MSILGDLIEQTIDLISDFKKQQDIFDKVVDLLIKSYEKNGTVFILGNGGSAATSSHIACDLSKGLSESGRKGMKTVSLSDNISTILAYSNDLDYSEIFIEQLKTFLNKDDIVIGISGSGNSKNVLNAIEYANKKGVMTVGLTGFDGGKLKRTSKISIYIPTNNMQIAENMHLFILHAIYAEILKKLSTYTFS